MKVQNVVIEVCANSLESAIAAQAGTANRIELCDNLGEGGTTPSYGAISVARKLLDIDINVIIRPRGGDFLYSDTEFEVMKADIRMCKELGVHGVVLGILLPDGRVDMARCRELIALADGMSVTFHRAFDMTADPRQALEDVIELGCERLLSSGQERSAQHGAKLLAELTRQAGDHIIIMPGGGVSETNVAQILRQTNAREFHVSGRVKRESRMVFRNEDVSMGSAEGMEYELSFTDSARVRAIRMLAEEAHNVPLTYH
jgi:copper homeostasis protein